MEPHSLDAFFRPRSIAVVGASSDPLKIGGRPVALLKESFPGPLYPVSRSHREVQGLPAFPTVSAIGAPVDLALICLPAAATLAAVEDCAAAGVKAAIVIGAGFAEAGAEGRAIQDRIGAVARTNGIRILGPNCMGLVSPAAGVIATFTTALEHAPAEVGRIGLVSQSGAFAAHAHVIAHQRGLGFSRWVTTGNECDVDVADCLAYLARDPETDVIMGYLEGCRDGAKLAAALDLARRMRKPVVMVKVGRSSAGEEAVRSHTAALTGSDAVFDAVFREHGVHRARTIDEFFDVAYAASHKVFPPGNRLAVVTISGGVGVFMADHAAEIGLDVARLPAPIAAKLQALLPYAGVRNPIDMTAQIVNDPSLLERSLEILIEDGDYDAIAVFLTSFAYTRLRDAMLRVFENTRRRFPEKLIALCTLTPEDVRDRLRALGYLLFEEPSRTVASVAALVRMGQAFAAPAPVSDTSLPAPLPLPARPIGEAESKRLLSSAGFPVLVERLAATADEAAQAAASFGFPVALKIASLHIPHKSEIGGVLLGIATEAAARDGFSTLLARARQACPNAAIDGVLVAPMVEGGVETILGARSDATFGPIVMLGLGGIFVEALNDVVLRRAPVDERAALEMTKELKGAALLKGVRGRPPVDIPALVQAIVRLSRIAAANADRIESIDVNPFIVLPEGRGGVAVDALIVPRVAVARAS